MSGSKAILNLSVKILDAKEGGPCAIVDVPASNEIPIKGRTGGDPRMPPILDEGMYESVDSCSSSEDSDTEKFDDLKRPMPPTTSMPSMPPPRQNLTIPSQSPHTGSKRPLRCITLEGPANKNANRPPRIETDLGLAVPAPFRGPSLFDYSLATSKSVARNLAMWVDVNANISPMVCEEAEKWGMRSNPARSDPARMRRSARMYERLSHASAMDPGKSIISAELDERALAVSQAEPRKRTHTHRNTALTATTVVGILVMIGGWIENLVQNVSKNGSWGCIGFVPIMVISVGFVIFPVHVLVVAAANFLGPVRFMSENSQYYSYRPPEKEDTPSVVRPVVVHMPVYTEPFEQVIVPSIESALEACYDYENRGGGAHILVCDDGYDMLGEDERRKRREYYESQPLVSCVARPRHGRRGRFKKASNLNFCIRECIRSGGTACGTTNNISPVYTSGNLNMGDFVMLIDADTRVPLNCISGTMREFEDLSLGFTQHLTTPLNITYDSWEAFIAHFTRVIYNQGIAASCAGGDPAPLVGHNAILRWSAMDSVRRYTPDKTPYWWSEDRVSEDFDMSMRMAANKQYGRYVTHTGFGFLEGVSLSYDDEVSKFRKFAFGSSEIMFNPFIKWFSCGGPLSGTFRNYIRAKHIPWHSKIVLTGYMFTYFAMAWGFGLLPINCVFYAYSPAWRVVQLICF
jgi:hypothetical protein